MELATFKHSFGRSRTLRSAGAVALLALALTLSACGGGGSDSGTFDVTVVIAGQPTGGTYGQGSSPPVYVRAGQSIELDASEPVYWTLYVAGTAVSGSGTTVHYAGADVTLTAESSSRIAVDTYAAFPLSGSIPITLVATSTFDSAVVATVNVLITN
ncbi:MAG: hypothetical protein ABI702_18165 [Burkholderiales bacterium]